MDQNSLPSNQRRTFLTALLAGFGAVLGGLIGWPILRYLSPKETGGADSKVTLARDKVPVGGAHLVDFRGRPAVVLQPKPGDFTVLSAVCTHLGCIVKWQDDKGEFLCPCHGGRFSPAGIVLGGPPPAPLESFPVALDGDQLVIG
jgi:cytochrome b6-f complex iron-sulfur subunit